MVEENFRNYCTKCKGYKDYECALYRREGEDTYDFRLCHEHEEQLWNDGFLPDDASFEWQDEEEELEL